MSSLTNHFLQIPALPKKTLSRYYPGIRDAGGNFCKLQISTEVRHGESMDNLRTVWAGWADAPLSNHGMNQARAAGTYFASTSTQFSAMYLSDLKRAHSTGMAIHESQRDPKPRITVSELLREQHWGEAEGKPWSMKGDDNISREELYKKGVYPVIYDRVNKFPGGESLNDLQARAEIAIDNFVMPHVWELAKTGKPERITLVSHGLCISELIAALVRKDHRASPDSARKRWTGLLNTAWSRVEISIPVLKEGETLEVNPSDPPPLKVEVTKVNVHDHLNGLKRQQGGIGSSAHDPAQKDIRAFFGGGKIEEKKSDQTAERQLEEGRAVSNAIDET